MKELAKDICDSISHNLYKHEDYYDYTQGMRRFNDDEEKEIQELYFRKI